MFSWEDLGEKTLSKIATVAISSQIKYARELEIQIKTNPNLLAKGVLESLLIEAKDIQVTETLLLNEMRIFLQEIEVNPFKALIGNIKLNYPSAGLAHFYISQDNLLQAWQELPWRESISSCSLHQKEYLSKLEIKNRHLTLTTSGEIYLKTEFLLDHKKEIQQIELLVKPEISSGGKVQLEVIDCLQGKDFTPMISDLLLEQLLSIFNLTDLMIDGLSFQTNKITIKDSLLTLQAKTQLTHFPRLSST